MTGLSASMLIDPKISDVNPTSMCTYQMTVKTIRKNQMMAVL